MKRFIKGKYIAAIAIFSLPFISYSNMNIPHSANSYEGMMYDINNQIKNDKEASWNKMSVFLKSMTQSIDSNSKIPNSDIKTYEELWGKLYSSYKEEIKKACDYYVKNLSKQDAKSDFINALDYPELRQLMDQDYDMFILKKMSSAEFDIYYGFWDYVYQDFMKQKRLPLLSKTDKVDFTIEQIKSYLNLNETKNNDQKIFIMVKTLNKTGEVASKSQLKMLLESTNSPILRKAVEQINNVETPGIIENQSEKYFDEHPIINEQQQKSGFIDGKFN